MSPEFGGGSSDQEPGDAVAASGEGPVLPMDISKQKFSRDFFLANRDKLPTGRIEGGRSLGLYRFEDSFVKVAKRQRSLSAEQLEPLRARLVEAGIDSRVVLPIDIFEIPGIKVPLVAVVMPLAPGISAATLSEDEVKNIPDTHFERFLADMRVLSNAGVQIDATKKSNFFYDNGIGFIFIDIDNFSEEPTRKFISNEDGTESLYAFEKYPFFPKKLSSARQLFGDMK